MRFAREPVLFGFEDSRPRLARPDTSGDADLSGVAHRGQRRIGPIGAFAAGRPEVTGSRRPDRCDQFSQPGRSYRQTMDATWGPRFYPGYEPSLRWRCADADIANTDPQADHC